MIGKLFDDWRKDYVRPVLVSLATAGVMTLSSWTFDPIRNFLAPPKKARNYPLFCTAEPYVQALDGTTKLVVEFFIINKSDRSWTRKELAEEARQAPFGGSTPPTAAIHLRYLSAFGKVERATFDADFNRDKGSFQIHPDSGNNVEIVVERIAPRAITKATVVVSDLPNLADDHRVKRTTKVAVPFDFQSLQDACYSPDH